ncbi:N-acetyltransferase, partial [Enterococcus hirae]
EEIKYGISKTFLMFIKQKNNPLFLLGFFSLTTDRVQIIRTSKLTNALKIWGNPIMPQSIPAIRIHYFAIHKDKQRKKIR